MLRTRKWILPSRLARTAVTLDTFGIASTRSIGSCTAGANCDDSLATVRVGAETVATRPIMLPGMLKIPDTMPREFRADYSSTRSSRRLHFAPSRLNDSPFPLDTAQKRVGKGALAIGILAAHSITAHGGMRKNTPGGLRRHWWGSGPLPKYERHCRPGVTLSRSCSSGWYLTPKAPLRRPPRRPFQDGIVRLLPPAWPIRHAATPRPCAS